MLLTLNGLHKSKTNTYLSVFSRGVTNSAMIVLKSSPTVSLLPEWGKIFLDRVKDTVFYALDCTWGPKRMRYIADSWIMENLLTQKGNLCLKSFCAYNICFCCICDSSCKYCHQSKARFSEITKIPAETVTRAKKEKTTTCPRDLGSAKEFRLWTLACQVC